MSADPQSSDVQVERLQRQQAGLAEFGLHAFRAQDLDDLLHEAAALVSQALDVRLVKILEWRHEEQDFLVRAGVNWKPGVVGSETLRGATTGSPAGFAFRTHEPVISSDVAAEDRFEIPDVLVEHGVQSMVNVIIAGAHEPFGVLEVDAGQHRHFDENDVDFLRNYANLLAAAVDRLRAHTTLRAVAEERALLVRELQHRVKNVLTLVQSFARLTKSAERTADEYREVLLGRLDALARAHRLCSEHEGEVQLLGLVQGVLEPYVLDRPEAVELAGEAVKLEARQALTLGLTLHELATNAAKYGALSTADGRVQVSWHEENDGDRPRLELLWRESGGPSVAAPEDRGFGSSLIERVCTYELDGEVRHHYAPDGVTCEIGFPLQPRS